uniref:condensin-2 complex subunit D3 isoform X2 n=1 Tax=Solea senegalensis TaxID=28829 RepID=UPI001CD8FD6D|nr:condensin-2 complex subunit D3 isoform X2 [Solea senegalensis]
MELISALQFLRLHEIPEAWVETIWDLEFTEIKSIDDHLDEQLTASGEKAFGNLYQCFLSYADQEQSAGTDGAPQNIWAVLIENGVSIKTLVAVLSFFVLSGKAKVANVQQRVTSLHAASVYLLMLGIPGSVAHKVYHEVLFDTCSDLSRHCWPQVTGKKRKKDGLKSARAECKRSKPQRKDTSDMQEEEEEEEELNFSGSDLKKIRDAVFLLVQSHLRLLQTFPLKDRPQSRLNYTPIFIWLLYFEPVTGELNFGAVQDINKLRSVPEMAFYGLQRLCSPEHGDQAESLRRVFHHLLYVILMMNKGSGGKPSLLEVSQAVLATRDQAIHFVCHLVDELKELALPFLQILLQHICIQMVEKSEFRSHGAQAVGMLLSEMSGTEYARFIKWLSNCSRSRKMVCRLFSVDVVMVLLEQPERRPEECQDPDLAHFLPHKFLIQNLLFSRQMDESPTVQGHALSCLAKCLEIPSLNVTRAVHNLFSATGTQTVLEGETTHGTTHGILASQQKTYRTLPFRTVEISTTENSGYDENMAHILLCVKDSKTVVRKSALQALVGLLKHGVVPLSPENLARLSERSRDPAVSVKKKALQSVGELLAAKPECSVVQKAWLQGVVPAVLDSENTVQDKALEALHEVLLRPIQPYTVGCHLDASERLTWDLLDLLCHDFQNLSHYFSRAFPIWSRQNMFTAAFMTNLISHTEADHAAGAWLLLSKSIRFSPILPYSKILDAWYRMISSKDANVATSCHILCVMGDIAVHLDELTKNRIVSDLMAWLKTFNLSIETITAALETLQRLGSSESIKNTQAFLNQHGGELVSVCEAHLAAILLNEKGAENLNEELMIKHLHTLGVLSLLCPAKFNKRIVLLVESVLTARSDKPAEGQVELPASQPLSQFRANSLPTRVRAHGVITLGKLCLQHEELVPKYLPVFARELEVGTEVAVRNNVVVAMCDLCVRYTAIVDQYIPNISACLLDTDAAIREQALIMLTNLLQEEFVKWKGSLFFCFMLALIDPVPAIASLCRYCLVHQLLKKNPDLFSQHFIECIFHFNSYTKHKSYNTFPQSESDKVRFSLKGVENRDKRFQIYRFLLENCNDVQRFNVTNKINQAILASFADEELPLDAGGAEILSEAFNILSLKELKLQTVGGVTAGEEAEEENMATMAKVALQAAQKKTASQIHKKVFIEHTVPLIISLKSLLEEKRSPALRDLMAFLQVTMQDNPNKMKELFSGDEQLLAEVEFSLKTAEKERVMSEMDHQFENFTLTGDANTPTAQDSPQRSRLILPVRFATPQPARPYQLSEQLSQTDGCMNRRTRDKRIRPNSDTLKGTVLEKRAVGDRAISTPKVGTLNLTFDEGFSAIFSDRGTSLGGDTSVDHVQPQEQQAPQLRQWDVQSPLRQKKRNPKFGK